MLFYFFFSRTARQRLRKNKAGNKAIPASYFLPFLTLRYYCMQSVQQLLVLDNPYHAKNHRPCFFLSATLSVPLLLSVHLLISIFRRYAVLIFNIYFILQISTVSFKPCHIRTWNQNLLLSVFHFKPVKHYCGFISSAFSKLIQRSFFVCFLIYYT